MGFDVQAALKAGYSNSEIADEMASNPQGSGFDVAAARKAGYSDDEIIKEVSGSQPTNLLGAIVGPKVGNAVHDAFLAVTPGSVQRGVAHAAESAANTADILGATSVGSYLHNQVNKDTLNAPTSTDAVTDAIRQGHYGTALLNVPGAVGEAVPQLAAAVGVAGAGTAVGGPAGLAAGLGGEALLGIATQAGDIAKARAKADGRSEVSDQDIAVALGSSALLGAVNRLGLGDAAGSILTSTVKRLVGRDAAGTVGKVAGSAVVHGASDAAQSTIQQAAETAGTAQGTTIDPSAVAAQSVIGGASRTGLAGVRGAVDLSTGELAARNRAAAKEALQSDWAKSTPEDQTAALNAASARQALLDATKATTENPVPPNTNVAARTTASGYAKDVNALVDSMSNGSAALLTPDQSKAIKSHVSDALNNQRFSNPDDVKATLDATGLPQEAKSALGDAISQIDMLTSAGIKDRNTSQIGKIMGTLGAFAGTQTPHPFLAASLGGEIGRSWGDKIATKLGWSRPELLKQGDRAAAMLDASGVAVPDTRSSIVDAIGQTQDAMKVMAKLAGLDDSNYGWTAAEKRAMDVQARKADLAEVKVQKQTDKAWDQNDRDKANAQKADDALAVSKDAAWSSADAQKQADMDAGFRAMAAARNAQPDIDPNNAAVTRAQIAGFIADQSATARDQSLRVAQREASAREGDRQAARGQSEMDKLTGLTDRAGLRVDRATQKLSGAPNSPVATQVAGKPAQAPAANVAALKAAPATSADLKAPTPELGTATPDAQSMAAKLPRWKWVMGQKVQKELQLSGTPRNINYAQEASQVLDDLHKSGWIDTPLKNALESYNGEIMPQGFFDLLRQQWLLNHGIDRRTAAAQAS